MSKDQIAGVFIGGLLGGIGGWAGSPGWGLIVAGAVAALFILVGDMLPDKSTKPAPLLI